MRVFLDANILFSGALLNSRMRDLLEILFKRAHCLTNAYAVEEARRNLELKMSDALPRLEVLVGACEIVSASAGALEATVKPKDMPILGGAVAAKATHLLTGDERDFGRLFGKTIQGVTVVSPRLLVSEMVRLRWIPDPRPPSGSD